MKSANVLGLDWEGVITEYPTAMAALAQRFASCVIITQKRSLTPSQVARYLRTNPEAVALEICPSERQSDYQHWKAEMCLKHNVAFYLDDDPTVVNICKRQCIPAVLVGRIPMYVQELD
ncbi:hypothetical protein JW960_15945 [candidate division KSB1 bacterium]|nr:hypothetical protein [candidate division KSB1 bacterium]